MTVPYGNPDFPYPWQYAEWYQRDFMKRNCSKQASSLSEYQFADLASDAITMATRACNTYYLAVFEQLDDINCCIRFTLDRHYQYDWRQRSYIHDDRSALREDLRIFISAKGKPTSMIPQGNRWKIVSNLGYRGNFTFTLVNSELAATWLPLKYILPILQRKTVEDLLAILRHPIVEQLAKAGYPNIAKRLTECGQVNATLRDDFGVEKVTKLPMYKLLGVNKYLLAEAESQIANESNPRLISQIKKLYNRFDISDLSKETVTMLAHGFDQRWDMRVLLKDYAGGPWNSPYTVSENDRKNLLRLFRMQMNDDAKSYTNLWADILSTWKALDEKPELDLYSFRNWNDMERMHNALVQLRLVEDANRAARYSESRRRELERYQKDFEKLQEDRIEKYEYENDQFAVRVPKELTEITQEGMMLHHCVGGYVHQHATGSTNILFLRRRETENVPFYTIEIRGNKVIQIHGNHNRWLGNDPEAVPFMYTYLKHLGVKFDTDLLLNCGTGYSPSNISLPETALYSA